MKSAISDRVHWTPIGEIEEADRTFAVTPVWVQPIELLESIRRTGVVSPLRVQRRDDGKLRIVSGFRRFHAAAALSLDRLPCLEVSESASETDLFLSALYENLGARPFSEVERAFALVKLRDLCRFSETDLIERFLAPLGLRPDRFHLRQYLKLADLPPDILRFVPQLSLELARRLSAWGEAERAFFFDLLQRFRPGRNRQHELFELLDELRAIEGSQGGAASGVQAWRGALAAHPETDQLERILETLRRRRFPTLSRQLEHFKHLKASLRVPPEIRINVPRFFEGDRILIQFSARSPEELGELAIRLEQMSRRPELAEIFEML